MLYHFLFPLAGEFPVFNVFRYPSFRILAAGIFALVMGMLLGPWFIRELRTRQHGASNVREDVPERHQGKSGTPTMGGGLILFALSVSTLLFADLTNRWVWMVLIVTLGFGLVGYLDDFLKISRRNSKGLPGRWKMVGLTVVFLATFLAFGIDWESGRLLVDTRLGVPFVATTAFHPDIGWLYLPFAWLVVVGTANAVNITDGLDGLAIGPTIVSAITFLVLAYVAGTVIAGFNLADYLYIPHIEGAAELSVFCAATVGAGIAFLWFNSYPASVFMGDIGALALGGALGTLAVLTKNELASVILHGVFFVEIVSVMLQVASFKLRGKRIFRMAPIHHHFELKGWPEPKIIVRFWIVSILLALITLVSLKVR
ncbi:MAG: phospho-N-acetylmuramoyl-pentapeptide-transferase [Pseudomonadota bacterium]|nr:MAG: phospho-N-acetylmuramoyl-pentapeptide-transferase [Pseudomonadota bacterium]